MLSRLLKVRNAVCQTAVSAEWDRWAHKSRENKDKSRAVKEFITGSESDEFWDTARLFCKVVKPIVSLLRLVDSNMPSLGKVRLSVAHKGAVCMGPPGCKLYGHAITFSRLDMSDMAIKFCFSSSC